MIFGKPLRKRNKCLKTKKKMDMKPENIPDELLIQAKVVHQQLQIQTNTPDIV